MLSREMYNNDNLIISLKLRLELVKKMYQLTGSRWEVKTDSDHFLNSSRSYFREYTQRKSVYLPL